MPRDYEDLYDLDDMDNDEIVELIYQELDEYGEVDIDAVDIDVEAGFITLTGRVGTEAELQHVEHIVSDLLGAANYSNEIVIDELTRVEQSEGADEAATQEEEAETVEASQGERTDPAADHLLEDLESELYGTHNLGEAIQEGKSYNPPDRAPQEGTWSEENH